MRTRHRPWWLRVGPGRVLSGGLAAIVGVPLALVLARADGLPATRAQLSGGGAWLASPTQGAATLIDGASEQVVGAVKAPGVRAGQDLSVVQAGSSAYLVSSTSGTVSRVDGRTYEVSPAVQFGRAGGGGQLQVYAGRTATYVVDGQRRTASVLDPVTLRVRRRLALAAQPGPGQSVVDDAGRLWVVDANGLAWFDDAGKHERADAGGADARLVLVAGRPVLVDLARARAGRLTARGTVESWSCLDLRGGEQVELLGSATLGRVLAAIPATGMLVAAGDGGEGCGRTLSVGQPGDDFGPLVESGGFLFVPDRTSGRTAVVDLSSQQVAATLDVVKAGARLELVAKDGLVFYNNLDGDEAGVIRFAGGRWRVGTALRKYSPGAAGAKILTPGGDRHPPPAQQPTQPTQPHRPDGRVGGTPPPDHPTSTDPPVSPVDPGNPPPPPPPPPTAPSRPPAPPPKSPPPTGPATGTLTVQVVGAGSVTASQPAPLNLPAGTSCGADSTCAWKYPAGTTAVLQVPNAPTADVLLASLTGCASKPVTADSTTCSVLVAGAAKVVATFVPKPPTKVTLTVTRTGPGTVSAAAAGAAATPCAPTCSLTVVAGTFVRLTGTADGGGYLSDWTTAACATSTSTCDVPVADNLDVTVAFAPFLQLTVRTSGSAGSVSCSGGTCSGNYRSGDPVSLTATPGAQSAFSSWTGCSPASSPTCSVTMSADTTVTATFVSTLPVVTVGGLGHTATATTGASVSLSGSSTEIDIFVNVDSNLPIRHIELDNNFSDTCTDGHIGRIDPASFDSKTLDTGFPRLGYALDMPLVACGGPGASLPTLERGNFVVTATVVTDGGTVTTQPFIVSYTQ